MSSEINFENFHTSRLSCSELNNALWVDLNAWVLDYQLKHSQREIWRLIKYHPFSESDIDRLINNGWVIDENGIGSTCSEREKIIELQKGIKNYRRDDHLFHELMHAVYGKELSDAFITRESLRDENRGITEWLARKYRSNSQLLRYVINSFNLKPYIYDLISLNAFGSSLSDPARQYAFPWGEESKARFSRICMDGASDD